MDGTVGEIRIFSGDFMPSDWVFCDGRVLSGPSNPVLYAVLSNRFGGVPAAETFAVPRLGDPITGARYIICVSGAAPVSDAN